MTTIINNPNDSAPREGGAGVALGVVIALLVILVVLFFGIPYLRGANENADNNPDNASLDINVNTGGQEEGGGNDTSGGQ